MSIISEAQDILKKKKKKDEEIAPTTTTKKTGSSVGSSIVDDAMQIVAQGKAKQDIAPVLGNIQSRMTATQPDYFSEANARKKEKEEEEKWYEGWFQKGDEDVGKAILGTTADATTDATQGGVGIVEGIVDFFAGLAPYLAQGMYYANGGGYNIQADQAFRDSNEMFKADVEKFVAKDIIDEEAVAKNIISGLSYAAINQSGVSVTPEQLAIAQLAAQDTREYLDTEMEEDSVFAHKTDELVQSAGQLAGTAALSAVGVPWWAVTGATAWGGETENALKQGASLEEANVSGAISATAEVLTEKISGGIKFGGNTLDDALTKRLAANISSKFWRNAAKMGMDVAGEGLEEVLSEDISRFGQWLTYQDEKTLTEMLWSEEAMDAKIQAFISGGVLGGGGSVTNAVKSTLSGVDAVSGLTKNEQAVVDKIVENKIAEAEKNGEKVSKTKIYNEVVNDLEKGYISTDEIESVLGGEKHEAYKKLTDEESSLVEQQKALYDEYKELGKKTNPTLEEQSRYHELKVELTDLQQKIDSSRTNPERAALKAQLDKDTYEMVKGDKLVESFFEEVRSKRQYQNDVTKYEGKAREVIQKVIDSGLADDSNKSHEFWDFAAELASNRDMDVELASNEQILEMAKADWEAAGKKWDSKKFDGKTMDAYVNKGKIVINAKTKRAMNVLLGHEITHTLEKSGHYKSMQKILLGYAESKGELESRRKDRAGTHDTVFENDPKIKEMIDMEVTADLAGDYFFTNKDFIQHLLTKDKNIFQKAWDEVKYLAKMATGGEQKRLLERAKREYEKAWKDSAKSTDMKHSISNKNIKDTSTGYAYGESYYAMSYEQDGKVVATLEYGEYDGTPNVKMIEVDPEYRRKGIATKLMQELQNKYPDTEIDFGMATPDGSKFLDSITYDVTDEAVVAERQKLKDLQTELNDLQERLDVLYDTENLTEEQDAELHRLGDRWQEVYETIHEAAKQLQGKKATRTFVKTEAKYSLSDSDGKQLTKEQQDYFKDSKMRDENGNLKVMYHGTQDAGFHTFDAKMSDDDTSFFFVDRNDVAASYSGTTETYEAKTIRTAEDMNNFLAEIGAEGYLALKTINGFSLYHKGNRVTTKDTAQEIYEEFCWYEGVGEGDANYKVYLNLTNPLEVDAKGRPWNKIDAEFSQEVYDKYNSLTAEEKEALVDLAEWEDFRIFNSEIQEARDNELASAYQKMGEDCNIYDLFSAAADNFSEEAMRENARKYLKTRDYAQRAKEQGYDGVIFKNIIDNGGYSNGDEGASTVAIAFDSNQIKSVANAKPTGDPDIRFSLSEQENAYQYNLDRGDMLGAEMAVEEYANLAMPDSKIRGKDGRLIPVYHGTKEMFYEFDTSVNGAKNGTAEGFGIYLSDNQDVTEAYGDRQIKMFANITKPATSFDKTISQTTLVKLIKDTCEKEAQRMVVDGEHDNVKDAIRDTWISNYVYTYDISMDQAYREVAQLFLKQNSSDMDIVQEVMFGMAIRTYDQAMKFYRESLTPITGIDGFITKWENSGKTSNIYLAFDSSQLKSADAVTKDDNGKVIPLSERFNPEKKDIRYSLSNENYNPKEYGRWNVYGKDILLDKSGDAPLRTDFSEELVDPLPDDLAPVQKELDTLYARISEMEEEVQRAIENQDADTLNAIDAEYSEVIQRIREIEEDEQDRIGSIDETEAPPVMEAPVVEHESVNLTKKATADIVREVRKSLALTNNQMAAAKDIIERFRTGNIMGRENLIGELQQKFGRYTEKGRDEYLAEAQALLKSTPVNVESYIKGGIADYNLVKKSNFGKIRFSKKGEGVDQVYKDVLNDQYPDLFPADIYAPEDQLQQMIDVANMDANTETVRDVEMGAIEEAADAIINGLRDFRTKEDLTLSERESKAAFKDLLRNADIYAPEEVAPVVETPKAKKAPAKDAPIKNPNPKVAKVLTEEAKVEKEKSGIGSKLVAALVDKGMVFENLSHEKNNPELQAKYNYALPSNTEARAQYLMENGDGNVKSLKDIMKTAEETGKANEFCDYLYHVHNIDRMTLDTRFGIENKTVFGETVTADVSRKKAAQYEKANPQFKAMAQDVYAYNKYLRQLLVDNGVISQETADLWEKMYPHYVPVRRVDQNGVNITVPLDTNKTGVNAPVKRAIGGSSDIQPLFNTMAQRTEQTYRAIARNSFGIELKNTLGAKTNTQQTSVDEVIDSVVDQDELLKAGTMTSNPTFTVFENGERVEFEITEDMFDALKPAGKLLGHRFKGLQKVSDARRNLLTVWNPVFALYRNPIKDIQDVAVNSQHALKTYLNVPNAIYQLATGGNFANEYHKAGGKSNTYFDSKTNKFKKEDNFFKKVLGMPVRAIETAGEFIEEIPRLAEYIASRKENRSVERSMLDAARVTTNFAAGGDFTKFLNSHGFTFLNASVQGASQHVRNFREAKQQGLKGYVKVLAKYTIAGLPGILLNSLMWDDDEDYEELSDYVKQNYYVVAKTQDGKFVRIPKGRTAAVMQNLFEQMEHLVTGDDEADFGTFYELFMNNIAPNNPIENNILAPVAQAIKNEAWYGGELVPSRLQDLPAEEQFDESTDSISKWLGENIGVSPYKINYLLDQYSGGLGDVFLPMLTPEAESGDDSLMGNFLAPWKKEMTTDSVLNNKNPGDFYDLRDELEINANSKNATEEDMMKSMYMDSVSWEMSDLYKKKREVQSSDLSDSQKYEQVRELQEQINELAKNALGGYNNVRVNGLYSEVGDKRYNKDAETGNWYEIREKNSDGSDNWYYQMEQKVTKGLGISYGEYWNNREEYNYAYEKPERYTVAKAVGGFDTFKSYTDDLYDIKADKDENGKSISGSRKDKVIDYINNMDADYGTKIILFKSEYNADDTYNEDIIDYLNSRDDISYKEMETILKYLGFEVDSEGRITW